MSREKDSAIVYELVTSKYKIAQRNRVAKLKFLNEMKSGGVKRRGSEPASAQTEKENNGRLDLSVPGTPVSSRYVTSLRKLNNKNSFDSDSETENEDTDNGLDAIDNPSKFQAALEDGLKKFTADMEKLQDDKSHDPLRKYFEDSDRKRTFRRDFSEVVSEFPIKKKGASTIAKVERYFQESDRMKSFKRDFTEVVQTFDPRNPSGRDPFNDLKKPGTPISSRFIAVEKLSSGIENKPSDDIKISNGNVENEDKNSRDADGDVTQQSNNVKHDNELIIVETDDVIGVIEIENDEVKVEIIELPDVPEEAVDENDPQQDADIITSLNAPEQVVTSAQIIDTSIAEEPLASEEEKEKFDAPRRLKRTDSSASNISNVSIPGTPISSRDLLQDDDSGSEGTKLDNDEIKARAKEFVNEIEILVQQSFDDDDKQEIMLSELKKITTEEEMEREELSAPADESDEKLIIHETNPSRSGNKVEDYFENSVRTNTFQRTFSEVESFNVVSEEVKQKVENYFRESEQNKSFTRPFSQALNYIEPKFEVENLVKPGTPVSSEAVMRLKEGPPKPKRAELDPETVKAQNALQKAREVLNGNNSTVTVDEYFKQSQERSTYQRNFSEVLDELHKTPSTKNPEIEKYFEQSDAQNTFQRPFSQVIQSVAPTIDEILKVEEKAEVDTKPLHYQRSSRASSISSVCSDQSESDVPQKPKKHGKKYGIDKYFATSLYRTAYHRSNSRRESRDGEHDTASELKIVEDEDVFGETDLLRKQEFQHDDETAVTNGPNDVNENQTVQFWRDFLKPYNLNLQSEITTITKDDLLNNRTLE